MLILMVLVVVVTEVRYNASVEQDLARSATDRLRMDMLADAARQQAESVLLMDLEAAQDSAAGASGDAGGDMGGGAGAGLFGSDSGAGAGAEGEPGAEEGSGSGSEASVANTIASTDSRLDEWNASAALAPTLGEDLRIFVEVEDEDGKLNLLGLWTKDEVEREAHREMLRKLFDRAFEGTTHDLSFADATSILDRMSDWARGNRGSFDPIPTPKLKRSSAEEEAAESGAEPSTLEQEERNYPLTLGELAMIEGLKPEHMSGFLEDEEYFPGLSRYLTVWSHLELKKAPKPEDNPFAGSPFGTASGGEAPSGIGGTGTASTGATGAPAGGEGEGEGEDQDITATATNDGFVNANTAPLIVLRALAPDEIPTSFLEKIEEFRLRIDELRDEEGVDPGASLFDALQDTGDEDDDGSGFSDEDDEDVTQFVFEQPQEVIDKIEQEYGISLNVDPGLTEAFVARLGVTSQVFTIKVLIYDLSENPETGEPVFGRRASYRTVVWRMLGSDRPRILTLEPLEPYHEVRRMEDFGQDFEQMALDQQNAYQESWAGR
ncbi:MAG: hypothetical protein ACT4PU_07515 [Planctomycetota bacterium]